MRNTRLKRRMGIALALLCILLFAALHGLQGTSPLEPSPYNSYTLQALRWRQGAAALEKDVPHLELAIYKGQYFVSFPPVPGIPVFFLTFLFSENVPDALLTELYLMGACLLFYGFLARRFAPLASMLISFLFCFASSITPIAANGAVWYQAQALGFLCIAAAVFLMDKDCPTPALFLYALSVGCRPFHVLYAVPLFALYCLRQPSLKACIRKLWPGVALGLIVAASYALYNYVRFDDPLEFGHNHLPEFSFQGGTQFSFAHIIKNARTFLFSLPFEQTGTGALGFKAFGFSLFLANPALLFLLVSALYTLARRHFTLRHAAVFAPFILHTLLLLSHRTVGGFQWGARYFIDCIPYAFLFLALTEGSVRTKKGLYALCFALLPFMVMALMGAQQVHI